MRTCLILAAWLLGQHTMVADLLWEKQRLEFHPAMADTAVKGEFNFTNTGTEPVTIEAVEPGCTCTTATLEKKTYQPGERGRVAATFNIGQRTGIQDKSIRVRIRGEPEPTILRMVTHIPDLIKVAPQFVFWKVGEALRQQTIELTVAPGAQAQVTRVLSTDPQIKATLVTVQEGRTYKIMVTPEPSTGPVTAVLKIDANIAPDRQKVFVAYAKIVGPGTAGGK